MKQEAFKRIGHLYPTVKDENGIERTVVAWIWARTVKCPNPVCGCEMPLTSGFKLSTKVGREVYIQPIIDHKEITYEVRHGKGAPKSPKQGRGAKFKCVCCSQVATPEYIKQEGTKGCMGEVLMGIVAEGDNGRVYLSSSSEQASVASFEKPDGVACEELAFDPRAITPPLYGLTEFRDLFTPRQLTALVTFSDLIAEAKKRIEFDGGTKEYSQALSVYFAFIVDKLADRGSNLCSWIASSEDIRPVFPRHALTMVWDYAESNPFSNSVGSWSNMVGWVLKSLQNLPTGKSSSAFQYNAQSDNGLRNLVVSTDPPYYDNVPYANISDFYYIWLRQY